MIKFLQVVNRHKFVVVRRYNKVDPFVEYTWLCRRKDFYLLSWKMSDPSTRNQEIRTVWQCHVLFCFLTLCRFINFWVFYIVRESKFFYYYFIETVVFVITSFCFVYISLKFSNREKVVLVDGRNKNSAESI